ncbi:MAG TPA: sodium-dependent transporter [Gemmatimonadales bacterium]
MAEQTEQRFSSRWVMMLTMLGMAVGTGNIWRFPRIAAQNGGGEFIVAWIVFLFIWSIPLILVEFNVGRMTRTGPVRAFAKLMGPRWAWMGAWVAFVATAIMFYYSVVTGWTMRYVVASAMGEIPRAEPGAFWAEFTTSWIPVLTHAVAIALGVWVVARGVKAIEKVAAVLMPLLIILVVILTLRAVTLPGAGEGLAYLYGVDWDRLGDASIWLNALTQNAWDTGAGWGLALVYAAYLRQKEDTALNAFILPTANNTISLMAGMMVMCTVFSVIPGLVSSFATNPEALAAYPALAEAVRSGEALSHDMVQRTIFGAGNEGITFVWIPQLFAQLPAGRLLMTLFFLALSFAAFTSLMAMIELATRVLVDAGMTRARAIRWVAAVGFVLGIPSALSLDVLHNQDWVWGVGLMASGLFFSIAVIAYGVRRFREEQINHEDSDIRVGRWFDFVLGVLVPIQAVALIGWWMYQVRGPGWLNPFGIENLGTILFQWGVVLVVLVLANRWLVPADADVAAAARRDVEKAEIPASVP